MPDGYTPTKKRPGQKPEPEPPLYRHNPPPKRKWHASWTERDWPPLVGAFVHKVFREISIAAMCIVISSLVVLMGALLISIGTDTVSFAAVVDMIDPQAAASPGALNAILNLIGPDFRAYMIPGAMSGLVMYAFMTLVRGKH